MRASQLEWQDDRDDDRGDDRDDHGGAGGSRSGALSPTRLSGDWDSDDVDWDYRWTPAARRQFLEVLAATGTVLTAARSVGKSRRSAYLQRSRADAAAFRMAWDAATLIAQSAVADALMDRALHGYDEIVEALGKGRIRRRRFDHGLGFRLLDRLDRMAGAQPQTGSYAERVQMVVQDFAGFLDLVDPAGALAGAALEAASGVGETSGGDHRANCTPASDDPQPTEARPVGAQPSDAQLREPRPDDAAPLETKSAADDGDGRDAGATGDALDGWFAGRSTAYQTPFERELARNSAVACTVRYRARQAAWRPVMTWFDALRVRLAEAAPERHLHEQSIIELLDAMEQPDFPITLSPGDEAELSILLAATQARITLTEMESATPRQPEREAAARRRIEILDSLSSQQLGCAAEIDRD